MQLLLSHELQIPGARGPSPAELRGHMEERFTWAVSRGQAVSALACEPIGLGRVEHRNPGLTPRVLSTLALALEPAFRAAEAVVTLEEGCLVVLLVGADPKQMEAACREWVGGAKELRIDGVAGPLRLSLMLGYGVTQPGKRLFLDTLILVARAGLDVARYRGAGACVHTFLYDFVQDRLERERGTKGIVVTGSAPSRAGEQVREPDIEDTTPVVAEPRSAQGGAPPDRSVVASPAPGFASARESLLPDMERRERELTEALDARRRENDTLRARLHALETRDDPPGDGASRGTPETMAAPSESAQDRLRIDQLERRLAKVLRSLEETEGRLARVSPEDAFDFGIASCYRTVQGLAADAPHHARKAALMEQILEANLELREDLRCGQPTSRLARDGRSLATSIERSDVDQ